MKSTVLLFFISCIFSCEPEPIPPSPYDKLDILLGAGVWSSDYIPGNAVMFLPNSMYIESIDISVNQVIYSNGQPKPFGTPLKYDLVYLNTNNWRIDVWKNEYMVNITIVQTCTGSCNGPIWHQTAPGPVQVSCFVDGSIIKGKPQWTFYTHIINHPIPSLTITPTFVKCIDCGCG